MRNRYNHKEAAEELGCQMPRLTHAMFLRGFSIQRVPANLRRPGFANIIDSYWVRCGRCARCRVNRIRRTA